MNKHNAAQYLPLVQALADGKEVQRIMGNGSWNNLGDYDFQRPPDYYRIVEPTKPMTTPTTRTPQQASIEAREAREAWERGDLVYFSKDVNEFEASRQFKPFINMHVLPDFSDPTLIWRVAKPTPPVITPGKWRTREGKVEEIEHGGMGSWQRKGDVAMRWYIGGNYLASLQHPHDLLTRVETKWRPWKPEEVPLGREVRSKNDHKRRELIYGTGCCDDAFANYELLLPDGTYAPCGVEEVVG